jgi:hypothetical protein
MADLCARCNLPAHIGDCLEAQRIVILTLLKNIGTPGACRGCLREITWVRHANGKTAPYDPSGLNHFISCPEAGRFKGKSRRRA